MNIPFVPWILCEIESACRNAQAMDFTSDPPVPGEMQQAKLWTGWMKLPWIPRKKILRETCKIWYKYIPFERWKSTNKLVMTSGLLYLFGEFNNYSFLIVGQKFKIRHVQVHSVRMCEFANDVWVPEGNRGWWSGENLLVSIFFMFCLSCLIWGDDSFWATLFI